MVNEADLVPVLKKDLSGIWLLDTKDNHIFDEFEHEGYLIRRYRPRVIILEIQKYLSTQNTYRKERNKK